jgi:hypothetical protein
MIELIDDTDSPRAAALRDLERDVVEAAIAWNAVGLTDSRTLQDRVDTALGAAVKALLTARRSVITGDVILPAQED